MDPQVSNEAKIHRYYIEEDAVVRALVFAVTRGHREAEDVIQTIWQTVCRKFPEYDAARPFRAWLLGIARLEVLKWRQAQARSRVVLDEAVVERLAETAATLAEELDWRRQFLVECLRLVPSAGRRVLEMKYLQGLSHSAIARRLERSLGAVEMNLVRLRRTLRMCIEGKIDQEQGKRRGTATPTV